MHSLNLHDSWDFDDFLLPPNDSPLWNHTLHRLKANRPKCGAKCRDGHACLAKAVVDPNTKHPINGRCRMHGGLSTGAKTIEGKEKCRRAGKQGMINYWKNKKLNASLSKSQ